MRLPATLFDPESGKITTVGIMLIGLAAALLLTPLLIFPHGPDASLFFVAGEKIVHQGAIHYRDIVDVKPPLIYYFNALAIVLFGDGPGSANLLDYLVQLYASMAIFFVVRKATGRDRWGLLAALLYPILYIGVSAQGTIQTESMVAAILFSSLGVYFGGRSVGRFAVIGLLGGIAIFFKFTLGVLLLGLLVGDLLLVRDTVQRRLRLYAGLGAGAGFVVLLFLLYLTLFDAWTGFNQMRLWTAGYAGMQFASLTDFVATILREVPVKLADEYSLTMLIGTIVAMWIAFRSPIVESSVLDRGDRSKSDRGGLLLGLLTIQLLLLLATVALEGKWMHYHVMRFYGPGAVLAAFGLIHIFDRIRNLPNRRQYWLTIPVFAFLLLGLSPLSRYVFHARPALAMIDGGVGAYDDYYGERLSGNGWSYREIDRVGGNIREALGPGERVQITSGVAALLYRSIGQVPETSVFHSGFVIAPYAPEEWRTETKEYILEKRPRFVVLQTNDEMPLITTVDSTSWQTVMAWPEVGERLREDYRMVDSTNSFVVLERSDDREPRYQVRD
jgi:hypothetical protein